VESLKPKITKKAKAVSLSRSSKDEDDSVPVRMSGNEGSLSWGDNVLKYFEEELVSKECGLNIKGVKRGFSTFV
jgi:hypothetical protein